MPKKSTLKIDDLYTGKWYIFLDPGKYKKVQLTHVGDYNAYFDMDEYGYCVKPEQLSSYKTVNGEVILLDMEE